MMAPRFWSDPKPGWIARALSPLGALYGAATARRMAMPGEVAGAPVLCVGNFVAGGAGKTPTAIALAKLLISRGERVAFLSRGYGGETRSDSLRVDPNIHGPRQVGDEPLLLARIAPCFVGPDRVASARAAVEAGASVLMMDDGLQNPALAKNRTVAVVDGEALFGNGLCIPAGPLRARLADQMPYVDSIVAIGGDLQSIHRIAEAAPDKAIFRARLRADALASVELIGRPVFAFAGIARPGKFFASLAEIGATVVKTRAFADHHLFRSREIEAMVAEAAERGLSLVTTEKDHVRIPQEWRGEVMTLPVTLSFEDPPAIKRWLASVR